jgi:mRNA-degrading endonuclease HigB of HigAB toxin-antitoxin module
VKGADATLRVISKRRLREFWEKRPEAKDPLLHWYRVAKKAAWKTLADVRMDLMNATVTKKSSKAVKTARATVQKFNRRKYAELLTETLPAAITDEEELERITAIVDRLAVKKNLSSEESRLLDLLSTLIEVYEDEHHPIPDAPPHVMI